MRLQVPLAWVESHGALFVSILHVLAVEIMLRDALAVVLLGWIRASASVVRNKLRRWLSADYQMFFGPVVGADNLLLHLVFVGAHMPVFAAHVVIELFNWLVVIHRASFLGLKL